MNGTLAEQLAKATGRKAPVRPEPPRAAYAPGREIDRQTAFFYFYNLGHQTGLDVEAFAQNWRVILSHDLNPKELCIVLHRTAKASRALPAADRTALPDALQDRTGAWEDKALERLPAFNNQELSNALWAFAALGIAPSARFLESWINLAAHNINGSKSMLHPLRGASSLDLANDLWAFAKLRIDPPDFFIRAWINRAIRCLHDFNPQDLANSLWAAAALDAARPNPVLRNAARAFYKRLEAMDLDVVEDRKQLHDAGLWFSWEDEDREPPAETKTVSLAEQNLSALFRQAGMEGSAPDHWIGRLKHRVDIAFHAGPQRFLIECDGPDHFIRGGGGTLRYDGGTVLQSALIARCAPDAVLMRLRYPEGTRILEDASLLHPMMLESVKKGPGVYETFGREDGSIGLKPHLPPREEPGAQPAARRSGNAPAGRHGSPGQAL